MTAVASAVAGPLARRWGTAAVGAGLWIAVVGVLVTLTSTPGPGSSTRPQCRLQVSAPPSAAELLSMGEPALNVWMYVPLALLAVLPRRRRTWPAALAATAALRLVVEATQWAIPVLGRQCQLSDLVENLLGVAIGAAAGLVVRLLAVLVRTGRAAADLRNGG